MIISRTAEKRLLVLVYFLSMTLMIYISSGVFKRHQLINSKPVFAAENSDAPGINEFELNSLLPGDSSCANLTPMNIGSDAADSLSRIFTKDAKAADTVINNGSASLICYGTKNRMLAEYVLLPWIQSNYTALSRMPKRDILNAITLKVYGVYRRYLGASFYRWGGDIFDLDDPQPLGVRYQKKYGLDCSGFVTSGYELAVFCGLISDTSGLAVFSSKGLKFYTKAHKFVLRGSIFGGNNNYRLDTSELAELGAEVFHLKKGDRPSEEQIKLLMPCDLAGRNGHFGIITFIDGKAYYLESGGYVLPKYGFKPVPADKALAEFASHADISIRRAGM